MYRLLIGLFLLAGCSVNVNHKATGEVKIKVEFDPKALLEGFTQACVDTDAEDLDECVNRQLGDYFRSLVKALEEQQESTQ